MKKTICILILMLGFAGCETQNSMVDNEDLNFFEFDVNDAAFYFEYPASAIVEASGEHGNVVYNDCRVDFIYDLDVQEEFPGMDVSVEEREGVKFTSLTNQKNGALLSYIAENEELNTVFSIGGSEGTVLQCAPLLERIALSLTDKSRYVKDDWGFFVVLLPDYTVEYLSEGNGFILKRWIEIEKPNGFDDMKPTEKAMLENYRVEMGVMAYENEAGYEGCGDLVMRKYPDYSTEFVGSGVYVDEEVNGDSVRHFFVFSEGNDVIYEAYLRVTSIHFNEYQEVFQGLVEGLEVR